jgi:hypothetical protein
MDIESIGHGPISGSGLVLPHSCSPNSAYRCVMQVEVFADAFQPIRTAGIGGADGTVAIRRNALLLVK